MLQELASGCERFLKLTYAQACFVIRDDKGLHGLLAVLSDFGSGGRYHHLDTLAGAVSDPDVDPRRRWEEIEVELIRARPDADQIFESADLREVAAFEIGSTG